MELNIHALEGGIYLAQLELIGDAHTQAAVKQLCRKQGLEYPGSTQFRSLGAIRDAYSAIAPNQVWLVHNVAYDQMIGLNSNEQEHRQPLSWYKDTDN